MLEALVPGVGELSFMQAGLFHWNGKPLWISRSGYTGEDGFEISVARPRRRSAGRCADRRRAGQADRPWRARFAAARGGPAALRPRPRLRRPRRSWPTSTSRSASAAAPKAASPARCGSWPSWRMAPAQKRVGLLVEGRQPVREGALILDGEGNEIGRITSRRPFAVARPADRHGLCRHRAWPSRAPR